MQAQILRIIDASLNRAAEGLRVVEDYARFSLDDAHLTKLAKNQRHDLLAAAEELSEATLNASRETEQDVGTQVSTPQEALRTDAWHVCLASLKRVEQSLRSLEEYGKLLEATFAAQMEQLRYRVYTLEKALSRTRNGRIRLADARLYVLADGRQSLEEFGKLVSSLVEAGASVLQIRDKNLTDKELVERARQLVSLTRGSDTLAIINDRPDIALVSGADGVHLGQSELSVKEARAVVGTDKLIGVSTHGIEQARQAVLDGADYLGAGPTFPSETKSFDQFPGLDYLRQVAGEISLPAFAIGGIDLLNIEKALETGIERVAVSGAVVGAAAPDVAARRLLEKLGEKGTARVDH